jgi:hypothetical protein
MHQPRRRQVLARDDRARQQARQPQAAKHRVSKGKPGRGWSHFIASGMKGRQSLFLTASIIAIFMER